MAPSAPTPLLKKGRRLRPGGARSAAAAGCGAVGCSAVEAGFASATPDAGPRGARVDAEIFA